MSEPMTGIYDSPAGALVAKAVSGAPAEAAFLREFYRLLKAYYHNNGLYDILEQEMKQAGRGRSDLKPLRNPAYRVVEFYASKLWPGSLAEGLPLVADNARLIPAIEQVWQASNWVSRKQRAARWFATYGDLFIKVATRRSERPDPEDRITAVYLQLVEPQYVSQADVDERGFVTYIRLDIPQVERQANGRQKSFVHTEVWDKATQIWRVWHHDRGLDEVLSRLDDHLVSDGTFADAFGADFVPFVYQPFRDDGDGRGGGAFTAALDKIDEANRQATRLAQILFRYNKALWALLANATDSSGRPLPPPSVNGQLRPDGRLELEDDTLLELPGMAQVESLVPNINYQAALSVLQDHMQEVKADLPELAYYDLRGFTQVSGRAVRLLLDDAISRVYEARGNGETAMIRAQQMALTIGVNAGLFSDLGSFKNGDFEHSFGPRPVMPVDASEMAKTVETLTNAGAALQPAAETAGMTAAQAQQLAQSDVVAARTPNGIAR